MGQCLREKTENTPRRPSRTDGPVQASGRKQAELCERLAEIARDTAPGARLPTVAELCERLGVSVVTLNNALRTLEAQGLVTRRPGVGIYAAETVGQRRLALICDAHYFADPSASPFWQFLLERARVRAQAGSERMEIFLIPFESAAGRRELPPSLVDDLRAGRFDGILSMDIDRSLGEWMDTLTTPRVVFAGTGQDGVNFDAGALIRMGVEALAEQGCRRIAYWIQAPQKPYREASGDPRDYLRSIFIQSLTEHGLAFAPELFQDNWYLVSPPDYCTRLSFREQGYRLAERIFGPNAECPPPDGIVSADDMMTSGLLSYLRQHDIRLGKNLRIATHANKGSSVLLGWEHELTLIENDPVALVDALFARLHARMDGDPPGGLLIIPPTMRKPATLTGG